MADTSLTTSPVEHAGEVSDIVHLVCCVEDNPTRAICGWSVVGDDLLGPDAEPECVVCADIANRLAGRCIHGGHCPPEEGDRG